MRLFLTNHMNRLAEAVEKIRPGKAQEIADANLSPVQRHDQLLAVVADALPRLAAPATAPTPQPPAFTRRPQFPSPADAPAPARNLAVEFERLVQSRDPLDHEKAARLYLKNPEAFMDSCNAATAAGMSRLRQQRANEAAEVQRLRRQRGLE